MAKKSKKSVKELPPIGTKMEATHKGQKYKAVIIKNTNSPMGRVIKFQGKVYYSMSAAAKAFTNFPVNGWRYWKY